MTEKLFTGGVKQESKKKKKRKKKKRKDIGVNLYRVSFIW